MSETIEILGSLLIALAIGLPVGLYLCHLLNKHVNPLIDDWADRAAVWIVHRIDSGIESLARLAKIRK